MQELKSFLFAFWQGCLGILTMVSMIIGAFYVFASLHEGRLMIPYWYAYPFIIWGILWWIVVIALIGGLE